MKFSLKLREFFLKIEWNFLKNWAKFSLKLRELVRLGSVPQCERALAWPRLVPYLSSVFSDALISQHLRWFWKKISNDTDLRADFKILLILLLFLGKNTKNSVVRCNMIKILLIKKTKKILISPTYLKLL